MRAGAGISTRLDPQAAIREAASAALRDAQLVSADFALVLASAAYGEGLRELAAAATDALGTESVLGVSVEGVIAGGLEVESNPAVAVLVLEGHDVEPFLIDDLGADVAGAGPELAASLGAPLSADDLVVLLPDPLTLLPDQLLRGVGEHLAPARVVGGAAGSIAGGPALAWYGQRIARAGLAGFLLRSGPTAQVAVTQACQAVTQPLEVTRSRGHWIYGLGGRPALEVYREAARGRLAEDLQLASRFLMVAIATDRLEPDATGTIPADAEFTVRHVVGFDEALGAISLPQSVPSGSSVWFSMLDSSAARGDLGRTLDANPDIPGFGLYFNCRARGESLFGVSGLEAGYLERSYGAAPIIGMFGAFQIAPRPPHWRPLRESSQLLTYAGVLTLFGL